MSLILCNSYDDNHKYKFNTILKYIYMNLSFNIIINQITTVKIYINQFIMKKVKKDPTN